MMTRQHRQEALSRAYVQAIAACCGLNYSTRALDYGLDVSLHEITRRRGRFAESGGHLDIQLKSTTSAEVGETQVRYDLEVNAYDTLQASNILVPRILVLVVLPREEREWVRVSEDGLIIRRCGYWMSLLGEPATTASRTIRLAIPRSNLFSVDGLQGIVTRLRKGEHL
jgi:hypothetical protein